MANLQNIAKLAEMDGVVAVDKPAGISAHDTMKSVKTHFNLVKVGHGGTLATADTGVFLLLLGNAARFSSQLMGRDRAYEATIRLGRATNTYDAEGDTVAEKPFDGVTRESFEAALKDFKGDVYMAQPPFSAVRMANRPGYVVVPAGEDDAKERLVHVYRASVLEFAPPLVKLSIVSTKGMSVRTFANTIGDALGCGACVESLRRMSCGSVKAEDAMPLIELMKLHPMDFAARVRPISSALA